MAIKAASLVKETSVTTGSGPITLTGAASPRHQTFADRIGAGNSFLYYLHDANGIDFESGLGTLDSVDVVTRDVVFESTNSDELIELSVCVSPAKHLIFIAPVPGKVTADMDFMGLFLSHAIEKNTALAVKDKGSLSGTATTTLDYKDGSTQLATLTGGIRTFEIINWPAAGTHGILNLWLNNAGLATLNLPAANYKLKNNEYTTVFADYLADWEIPAFTTDAVTMLRYETTNGGASVYGAVV